MRRLLLVCLALSLAGCSSDGPAPVPKNGVTTPAKNDPLPKGKTPAME